MTAIVRELFALVVACGTEETSQRVLSHRGMPHVARRDARWPFESGPSSVRGYPALCSESEGMTE